jgi:hypothetical protein
MLTSPSARFYLKNKQKLKQIAGGMESSGRALV